MLKQLVKLNLPEAPLQLAKRGTQPYVWDAIRKKHLVLTPEEWVRQHLIHYLQQLGYPPSNMEIEGGFQQNQTTKRTDILVYKDGKPTVLVECKAPQIKLTQSALDQASRYNLHYKANYIFISNGLVHYCAKTNAEKPKLTFLKELPKYAEL